MKLVFYISILAVVFIFAFTFIAQNPHDIEVAYYFGMVWDGPVAILLLITLGAGILFGAFTSGLLLLKLKIRLRKAIKQLKATQLDSSADPKNQTKAGA